MHAQRLGSAIAASGLGLVYGGAHVGLMGAVADAVLDGGGEVVGVITERLVRRRDRPPPRDNARGRRHDARPQGAHG